MKSLLAFLTLLALGQCKSIVTELDPEVLEANSYVDNLLAAIRTDPAMKSYDPLELPFRRQDVLATQDNPGGTHLWILTNGTATGISTLHRRSNSFVSVENGKKVIKVVTVTNAIQVAASLHAELSNRERMSQKLYGSIETLSILLEITLDPNRRPELTNYIIESIIFLDPVVPPNDGKFGSAWEELVHDAIYYGFSTTYGFDIGKIVAKNFRDLVESVIQRSDYPMKG